MSHYATRMARLSARIFGEVVRSTDSRSMKVVDLFKEPPLAQRKGVYDWYPEHNTYYGLTKTLRFLGLFRYSDRNIYGFSQCRLCFMHVFLL